MPLDEIERLISLYLEVPLFKITLNKLKLLATCSLILKKYMDVLGFELQTFDVMNETKTNEL